MIASYIPKNLSLVFVIVLFFLLTGCIWLSGLASGHFFHLPRGNMTGGIHMYHCFTTGNR